MRDLLVITPSRGRQERLAEMVREVRRTRRADTIIAVAVDSDDPQVSQYARYFTEFCGTDFWCHLGPRQTMAGWTNDLALRYAGRFRAIASFGDDHVPVTDGWDAELLAAIDAIGGTGISYGNDLFQGRLMPTAPVITTDIVQALGWYCLPGLEHFYVDNVWAALGDAAECLVYRDDVIVEHRHPMAGKARWDATYDQGADLFSHPDRRVFAEWAGSPDFDGPCREHFEIVRKVVAAGHGPG